MRADWIIIVSCYLPSSSKSALINTDWKRTVNQPDILFTAFHYSFNSNVLELGQEPPPFFCPSLLYTPPLNVCVDIVSEQTVYRTLDTSNVYCFECGSVHVLEDLT